MSIIKFKDLPYRRVTKEEILSHYDEFFAAVESAKSAEDVLAAREKLNAGVRDFRTNCSLANCRYTLNVNDAFYNAEREYYDEVSPLVESCGTKYCKYMLSSPFRKELEATLGSKIYTDYEVMEKSCSDAIISDMQEENKIISEYSQLMASMLFDWNGEKIPLSMLRGNLEHPDREVRRRAACAIGKGLEAHKDELDSIYDRLVKVRDRMAKKMGCKDFVQLGYYRMMRTGYTREMIETFRANVVSGLVPVIAKLKDTVKKDMGIDKMMFYDNDVYSAEGNPAFTLSVDEAFAAAQQMYDEMDPELGSFMKEMQEAEAFDVVSREGKWGGGYCTEFENFKQPFILANFNGTTGDVDVLTHEFGHAYESHCTFYSDKDIDETYGMETAECHSMSMEFLAWPYMDKFFGEKAPAYRYKHLADCLSFIPYGCIVDEFQHAVYEHPEYTPAQRDAVYLELEKKYRPYLSFEGIDYLEEGTRWQYQMHIYESPFYYIDYCLAQTVALGFLVLSRENYALALEKYKEFVKASGRLPFAELVENAGIASPFADGSLTSLGEKILEILKEMHK